jgi:hypothetical protein
MWRAVLEENTHRCQDIFLNIFQTFWPHKDEQKETKITKRFPPFRTKCFRSAMRLCEISVLIQS